MASVTNRIKEIKQPRGGYVNPGEFNEVELNDKYKLDNEENISAGIIGMAVDYLSRINMGDTKEEAFKISLIGAEIIQQSDKAQKLLNTIKGLDDNSIVAACKLVGYDVCFRAGEIFFKPIEDINPDKKTIENIRIMVNRTEDFIKKYGPIKETGMTFRGGYTKAITSGDADFMTEDTLWDFKVSKNKPNSRHTLQLLVYYLLGMHSDMEKYSKIKKLAIYNPRLNKVFMIEIDKISQEIIKLVEDEVIVYKNDNLAETKKDDGFFTITDLTKILKCSRYRIMQLYSTEELPLQKYKNKYVISRNELSEWMAYKEQEEKEEQRKLLIFTGVGIIIAVIMIIVLVGVTRI